MSSQIMANIKKIKHIIDGELHHINDLLCKRKTKISAVNLFHFLVDLVSDEKNSATTIFEYW